MQREFWNDTGPTSQGGETSQNSSTTPSMELMTTPTATNRVRSARGIRKNGNPAEIAAGMRSMSSLADSPASLFLWRDDATAWPMSDGCGEAFATLSVCSDLDLWWRKMSSGCLVQTLGGHSEPFFGTWPRAGTMRAGTCYRQEPLTRRIRETESSLLPTPDVGASKETRNRTANRSTPNSKHHDGVTLRDEPKVQTGPAGRRPPG